uniref:Heme oxygenase n=1 Tax=Compsopogon caeruleus TaxID=31354 RepID=A0A1Z1XB26_9RHOD|nr:heme oxygenase [Compsopogon caeruleus]ARX96071.1 heme oxygenase [Compsopogon caeruleus]
MSTNLASQLREKTAKSHSMAENVSFVKSFLSGVIDKNSYRKLVANLYFVYSSIEEEMKKNKDHPAIKPIYFPALERKQSLEKDLSFYYSYNWKEEIQPSLATTVYVDRIHLIGTNQPELLVAHAYTRYLGDLSGGQILKKIAQNAMNLNSSEGTQFYTFENINDEKIFKNKYREALNSLPLSQDNIEQIIAEANISFNLNMKIFQELNTSFLRILVMLLINNFNKLRNRYKKEIVV